MLKISTNNLQTMVGKLSKCGVNKLLEITKYYHITSDENGLEIKATDGNNFITVMDKTVKSEPFNAIVKADQFSKLVNRTSVDKMVLALKDNYLEVIGNGKYKVEIVTGETFPIYTMDSNNAIEVPTELFKSVIGTNKYACSNNIADGVLNGFYFSGDKAITTDGIKVCVSPANVFSEAVLFTKEFINLISALTDEKVKVSHEGGKLLFVTDNTIIFGSVMDGIEQYPDVLPLLDTPFESKCSLSKLAILNIIDRLTLFITPYEKNEVILETTEQGLKISTGSGSYEIVAFAHSENFKPFTCYVNGLFLKDVISAVDTELFDLHYGQDIVIKVESGEVVQLLATGEGDEE